MQQISKIHSSESVKTKCFALLLT